MKNILFFFLALLAAGCSDPAIDPLKEFWLQGKFGESREINRIVYQQNLSAVCMLGPYEDRIRKVNSEIDRIANQLLSKEKIKSTGGSWHMVKINRDGGGDVLKVSMRDIPVISPDTLDIKNYKIGEGFNIVYCAPADAGFFSVVRSPEGSMRVGLTVKEGN